MVLLAATLITLKLVRPALTMIALALIPAIAMLALGWACLAFMPHIWPRLIVGGISTALTMALGLQLLSPHLLHLGVISCLRFIERLRRQT